MYDSDYCDSSVRGFERAKLTEKTERTPRNIISKKIKRGNEIVFDVIYNGSLIRSSPSRRNSLKYKWVLSQNFSPFTISGFYSTLQYSISVNIQRGLSAVLDTINLL